MPSPETSRRGRAAQGFALPTILVVVSALLILAVGAMLISGLERNTARSFADRQRAELAARSGLEDVRGILTKETANDDFLVLQGELKTPTTEEGMQHAPHLFIARGKTSGSSLSFRYMPLFSTQTILPEGTGSPLAIPLIEDFVGTAADDYVEFTALPFNDKVRTSWLPIKDAKDQMVGRYTYWVEDLQSRVDASTAGNNLAEGSHKRFGWTQGDTSDFAKFPAPGLNPEKSKIDTNGNEEQPPLNQVALYVLDPAIKGKDESTMDNAIIDGRAALLSPDSVLAVSGVVAPLVRDKTLHLEDEKARALEEGVTASVQPYDEQALVPFAYGIDSSVVGKEKLNLNAMLSKPADSAVDEMAAWIDKCLPNFGDRQGRFPDDYLKTLAANAIDYADTDSEATVKNGGMNPDIKTDAYRGLDAYPLLSEVILHIKYLGRIKQGGRQRLAWQMILYTELWNHTNLPVSGKAAVSYENGMRPPPIGSGVSGDRFDDPALLGDTVQSKHTLTRIDDRYWSAPLQVDLLPNEYRFIKAATINYTMDVGSVDDTLQNTFEIYEDLGSSGISLRWNDREVDRSDKLVRGNSSPDDLEPQFRYKIDEQKQSGKANIPGHSYGPYNKINNYKNNMGDSRQALYLRGPAYPLSDNQYPSNVSPNYRNIRNGTIYKNASAENEFNVYGRVIPSEWPDGGHDVAVSPAPATEVVDNFDPTKLSAYPRITNSLEGQAPTMISNRGRFFSATELGRIFDPIMHTPTFDTTADTNTILLGRMPSGRVSWPSVEVKKPDMYYGGGNTLRIGRPEHPAFDLPARHDPADMPGDHAARLLDIFHAGKSRSEDKSEREASLVRIHGHINVNTASADAIRAVAGGPLVADPRLAKRTSDEHSGSTMAPAISGTPLQVTAPTTTREGDLLAEAIIRGRPYASPSELASALTKDNKLVFGNRDILPDGNKVQWSDAAAEEVFARVYESSTVRSRNYRVWVIGQSVASTAATNKNPEVLGEVRKIFTVFADPGERKADGTIDATKFKVKILNENDF